MTRQIDRQTNRVFPKSIPSLSKTEETVRRQWTKFWLENISSQRGGGMLENFNQKYPLKSFKRQLQKRKDKIETLEIGAGIGSHIAFEDLSRQNWTSLEIRSDFSAVIKNKYPNINVCNSDIQKRTHFPDSHFDRIIAVHVLEHLPDLPSALKEISRILKDGGVFSIVIPCEDAWLYNIVRKMISERLFNKNFGASGVNFLWLVKNTEHLNDVYEIKNEIKKYFQVERSSFFPFKVPFAFCNICIGMDLRKICLK